MGVEGMQGQPPTCFILSCCQACQATHLLVPFLLPGIAVPSLLLRLHVRLRRGEEAPLVTHRQLRHNLLRLHRRQPGIGYQLLLRRGCRWAVVPTAGQSYVVWLLILRLVRRASVAPADCPALGATGTAA